MSESNLPEWEQLLSAVAQSRLSKDVAHVLTDLLQRFDDVVLAQLEEVAGWRTARVKEPVSILGSLDGIETGVRQLIREQPLETQELVIGDARLVVPTEEELLRIKAVLILRRNATLDYLDFAALGERLGQDRVKQALASLDKLYPQPSGESVLQQLQVQLSNALPYDLDDSNLSEYRNLHPGWHDWNRVRIICATIAADLFDSL